MMTVKQFLGNPVQSSPDGNYWEPAIPEEHHVWWRIRLRDAWAVWKGQAIAIRQTTKQDLKGTP